ncbi:MAG: hypothetical protein PHD97_07840 [Bacteroidales bacterium]|nr:hypothetical protein [Bacteroidales bacterium]
MKKIILIITALGVLFTQCDLKKKQNQKTMSSISDSTIENVIKTLTAKFGVTVKNRIERGVKQSAFFWTQKDGSEKDFQEFCIQNFIGSEKELFSVFEKLSANFEILFGNYNRMSLGLKKPLHLDIGEITSVDQMFGGFEPASHFTDDFFQNKIAFYVILNFPCYSLKEKNTLGAKWTRRQWAYARMGDMFTSRVPAELIQKASEVATNADTYISEYNIFMGSLIDDKGKSLFPADMKLISHWGLRDELKSHYADKKEGLEKQMMIYEVMKHIIYQDIPDSVVNKNNYKWNPFQNKIYKNGKVVKSNPEANTRYKHLLNRYKIEKEIDVYQPEYSTYIKRSFEQWLEMPQEDIEKVFVNFVSSPQVKKVAAIISKRLGRKLQPFDIWYDGFKARSGISEDELSKTTKEKYPNIEAFQKGLPEILEKLNFCNEMAEFISSKVQVDNARGAGHAWGAQMKEEKSHLRTRIPKDGMDYKGYNISCHEFGHNVEQTISMQNVDYYMLSGVPNTAFTEALAFAFQKRDLELLGIKENNPDKKYLQSLDEFWASYEIMGVSLVDMNVWKWLYENPEATPEQLKEAVIKIAKEIWNKYYADVFGIKDQPILAVYSHMIDAPLYLSAYPIGHLIDFQIGKQFEKSCIAREIERMFSYGRTTPKYWMMNAVGNDLSPQPMLQAVDEALKYVK